MQCLLTGVDGGSLRKLLQEVPLDNGGDTSLRESCILKVRKMIAEKWLELRLDTFGGSSEDRMSLKKTYQQGLLELVKMYGPETPFAPEPMDANLQILPAHTAATPSPDSKNSSSPEAERKCPLHSFRFLANTKGVWTIVQVSYLSLSMPLTTPRPMHLQPLCYLPQVDQSEAVDGYRNFISVTESYHFKTPFTQWFTKNYVGGFLPAAHLLELGPGHAACRV